MIYAENILLCISIPLIFSLFFVKGHTRRFIVSFLVGMVVCLLSAYIDGFISFAGGMGENDTQIFIAPVIEELMKLLPILFLLFIFALDDTEVVHVAIGIGAGFATFENCCYILSFGANSMSYVLIRGMAVGVMHLVSVIAVSVGLVIARRFNLLSVPGITGAVALSMTFHALYNLLVSEPGVTTYIGYVLPIGTAAVMLFAYNKFKSPDTSIDSDV